MGSISEESRFNCMVVGVGGQGVVLASRLIAAACMRTGSFVRTAETIGMSQRGGSVASHVRAGSCPEALPSSMIPCGGADLIISFEPGEALKAMRYLAKGGAVVCAEGAVVPSSSAASGYDGSSQIDWLRAVMPSNKLAIVGGGVLSSEGLSPRCLNVLLLGAAVGLGALPFDGTVLKESMAEIMKASIVEMNMKALELGVRLSTRC